MQPFEQLDLPGVIQIVGGNTPDQSLERKWLPGRFPAPPARRKRLDRTAERVVFKEPTPISRDEKIVVKLLTPQEKELSSAANPKEVSREEDGKLVWRVNLKPGEKREFSLKLSVEFPADTAVVGLE